LIVFSCEVGTRFAAIFTECCVKSNDRHRAVLAGLAIEHGDEPGRWGKPQNKFFYQLSVRSDSPFTKRSGDMVYNFLLD
jgi:hypothetical protein